MVSFDITERPTLGLSARRVLASYHSSGAKADIALGGLPFQYAITDDLPYQRETADYKRQQIDTSREPGEQSLSQWWVRDQDSFHRGAGSSWYEPGTDASTKYRFDRSVGVDVWTKGDLSLLRRMDLLQATDADAYATAAVVAGEDVVFTVAGGTLRRDNGSSAVDYDYVGVGTRPVIAGSKVLAGTTAGIVSGETTGSELTLLWTFSGVRLVTPYWAKSRIIATAGAKLYELTLAGGNLDTTTPLYTHPSATFIWTAVAEAPGAILAAGRDGGYGYIFKFVLENPTSGSTPELGPAIPVASFPPGEEVYSLESYLGAYLAIGTGKGVRIGQVEANGDLTYGPLTIETMRPVRALSARDRFVYASVEQDIDGHSGCARIDLSEEVPRDDGQSGTGRYAWAYDVAIDQPAQITSVAFLGTSSRVVLAAPALGVYLQSEDEYVDSGYILTGKIRYATAEAKRFALLRVRADYPTTTKISIATVDSAGAEAEIFTLGAAFQGEDLTLTSVTDTPQQQIAVRLTLKTSATKLDTPTLRNLQVKATPLPRIQRVLQFPVMLMDKEEDRKGVRYGHEGAAAERLAALEEAEATRQVVVFEDFTSGEAFSVQIQSVRFVRRKPPSRNDKGFGGVVILQLLKL